jgi:Fe2+ transport system protein FeoA
MRRRLQQTPSDGATLEGQPIGAALRLVSVEGGRDRTMRLMQLGLCVGETVVVTHTRGRGVVVASAAGRIAIGPELARHIHVEPVLLDHGSLDRAQA